MTTQDTNSYIYLSTEEAYSSSELNELCERIISSGVLGRSRHYVELLRYLVKCSIEGYSPRELELAINGLGKPEDFDVSADSAVRVYVHQLRKKLDNYFESNEVQSDCRIVIPKGQYTIAALKKEIPLSSAVANTGLFKSRLTNLLLVAVVLLLAANITYLTTDNEQTLNLETQQILQSSVWGTVLTDDKPILLVMGDYYIFGELNSNGNIARMVREFDVNSRRDLEDLHFSDNENDSDSERSENYLDLDLSYMPEGSAFALASIAPVLYGSGKGVGITMMSDLTTSDIRSNHIVYIGYLSALEKLSDMTFAASSLRIGRSYDELFNTKTLEYYTSDAGLPEEGEAFRDYGMFATFPAGSETQIVMIAGMRDAGLMHTAQAVVNPDMLRELDQAIGSEGGGNDPSFEALFEVFGVDRLNFDANLIYTSVLDSSKIWNSSAVESLQ